MKLTPLDIHHKEFRHSLRGYTEEEVDQFLDEVADEFERLFKENIDLSEKLEAANEKVRGYQEMERTLHNTMLAAQTVGRGHRRARRSKEAELDPARRRAQGEGDRARRAGREAEGADRARAHQAGRGGVPRAVPRAARGAPAHASPRSPCPRTMPAVAGARRGVRAVVAVADAPGARRARRRSPAQQAPAAAAGRAARGRGAARVRVRHERAPRRGRAASTTPPSRPPSSASRSSSRSVGAGERDEDIDIEEID